MVHLIKVWTNNLCAKCQVILTVKNVPKLESLATLFTIIRIRIARKYDFKFISEYMSQLSFTFLSVLSAPTTLCKKMKFYVLVFWTSVEFL
jgi:hypothetical protein